MIEGDWLTAKQAAEISGYNVETIRRLLREGKIQAKKFTFVWMISQESLLEYVTQANASDDTRFGPKSRRRKSTKE